MNLAAHAELMMTLREDPEALVEDGAIVPDRYARAHPRIMWILREVNGTGERWSYADFLATDSALFSYPRWKQSLGLVARCSAGVLRGCVPWGEWADDASKLTESLRDIAVININKAGGDSRVDWSRVSDACTKFGPMIAKQLEYLDPEIVIFGGTCGWLPSVFPQEVNQLSAMGDSRIVNGRLFIRMDHPNQSHVTHERYYNLLTAAACGPDRASM